MSTPEHIVRVAIKTPLQTLFDYLPPADPSRPARAGVRVRVPFGRGHTIGMVVETRAHSAIATERLAWPCPTI